MAELELERRKPFLSARQVAIAAIFGGIAFAFEALKITIPGYMPGVNFSFIGVWLTLATMMGGPYVGIVVAFIESLAAEVGLVGVPGYAIHALVLAALYRQVFNIQAKPVKIAAFWGISTLALILQYWYWIFLYAYVFKLMPVMAQIVFHASGPLWIYIVIYSLLPSILLATSPKFVAPEWNWNWASK